MGARRIDVTWYGKAATFLLMGAFPAFLVSHSDASTADAYGILAWIVAIPGLVLSYYSAALYIPLGRKRWPRAGPTGPRPEPQVDVETRGTRLRAIR